MSFKHRSTQKEIIDLGEEAYSRKEYFDCLEKLDRVGLLLGGYSASLKALGSIKTPPTSILDVGCGGGFFAIEMGKRYPQASVVGIDINPLAIEYANLRLQAMRTPLPNVRFELREHADLVELPKSYDVVTSMLVCHHLEDDVIVDFLRRAMLVAQRRVIINDLHRNIWGYGAFKAIAPLLFRNRLVMHDGPLSVKRAFVRDDWRKYLKQAGIAPEKYSITWRWAFRYIVDIEV